MPHQCVKCNTFYNDGAEEILKGCSCGGKLFFYVKEKFMKQQEEATKKLSKTERTQIEKDVYDLIGDKKKDDVPVILDMESINISEPGKYQLDLVHIFKGQPLVYKVEEGKYMIDLPSTFLLKRDEE